MAKQTMLHPGRRTVLSSKEKKLKIQATGCVSLQYYTEGETQPNKTKNRAKWNIVPHNTYHAISLPQPCLEMTNVQKLRTDSWFPWSQIWGETRRDSGYGRAAPGIPLASWLWRVVPQDVVIGGSWVKGQVNLSVIFLTNACKHNLHQV